MKIKKRRSDRLLYGITTLLTCVAANSFMLFGRYPQWPYILISMVLAANLLPLLSWRKFPNWRMRLCNHGTICLRAFCVSLIVSIVFHLATIGFFPFIRLDWLWSVLLCFCVEAILFWNGMICVYSTSVQLGITKRAVGILLGSIPVAQLVMLRKIIRITRAEVDYEVGKQMLNLSRKDQQVCRTKYPLLLVHGVFFRDDGKRAYWGRIPGELEKNGAKIFYGNHQSAASVSGSAAELSQRIRQICQTTGCEKVNIIAHSKGGLDCRCAIQDPETAKMVASLTTINTPHRGCQFADYLLTKIPETAQLKIASTYNTASKKLGDFQPDFMGAVTNLTAGFCTDFDNASPVPANVFCQSVGSKLNHATDGSFPLDFSYLLVKYFDGANDGLVGESSFAWGNNYIFLTTDGPRGISHGDMVDLNRENIPDFDVREFYVGLVADLKKRGL